MMQVLLKKLRTPLLSCARFISADVLNSTSVKVVTSTSNDIIFNLATEEYLFEKSKVLHPILFLWRNDKTIVIGKHQNPWKECRTKEMERDGVNLARRKSGGGAVYQDLGNTCFSFLDPLAEVPSSANFKEYNTDVLLEALGSLGVGKAEKSGRNDIVIEGKKVSGSAYKLNPGSRTLHHGTMLINLDKSAANKYLNPNFAKLKSKGVDSVKARIINLVEIDNTITHERFCEAMTKAYKNKHSDKTIEELILSEKELHKIPEIDQTYKETSTWQWRFGATPAFSYSLEKRFDWGMVEICLAVENAKIKGGKIFSDCLFPDFIDVCNKVLEKPEVDHSVEGWKAIEDKMKRCTGGSEVYGSFLKDITALVHERI
eukprot:TRINITY_DN2879_c0_g2_i12.p1 TRINITY_DN2879_c0_g2~~TRINITY_DN2879_c0_g2_i12.p1  ORF type:complete len:373 (-),score=79.60 TRINITY_DN2879_c0_g2_i12:66-1184(-)